MHGLVRQIILVRRQNGLLARHDVGQLWYVSLIVFQLPAEHATHDNLLAYPYEAFAIIFTSESQFTYLFTLKMYF